MISRRLAPGWGGWRVGVGGDEVMAVASHSHTLILKLVFYPVEAV